MAPIISLIWCPTAPLPAQTLLVILASLFMVSLNIPSMPPFWSPCFLFSFWKILSQYQFGVAPSFRSLLKCQRGRVNFFAQSKLKTFFTASPHTDHCFILCLNLYFLFAIYFHSNVSSMRTGTLFHVLLYFQYVENV